MTRETFSEDTRTLLQEGVALQRQGRLDEAAECYRRILQSNPNQVNALQLMGRAALDKGRLALAEQLLGRAVSLKPDLGPAWRDFGLLWRARGDAETAMAHLARAAALMPEDTELLRALGECQAETGDPDRAVLSLASACRLAPDDPLAAVALAMALRQAGRSAEAAETCHEALGRHGRVAALHAALGTAKRDLGQPREAADAFRRALELDPDFVPAHAFLGAALLEAGKPAESLQVLEGCLALDPVNRQALAFKAIALGELDRVDECAQLLDFDRLIRSIELSLPPGYQSVPEFNAALARHAAGHASLVFEPRNKATRAGSQTGNLLRGEKGPVAVLEKTIRQAVDAYFDALPEGSTHPYARVRLPAWDLVAWATVLGRQGHQQPHIHPGGWLSGVYYVEVPDFAGGGDSQQGWIEFGGAPASFALARTPLTRRFCPRPGLMLLFPSYFYHSTVPYDDNATRISIAFDVIPRRASDPPIL